MSSRTGAASLPAFTERPSPLLPSTPVGRQLQWLCEASDRLPVPDAERHAHTSLTSLSLPAGLRVESFRAQPRQAERQAYAVLRDAQGDRHHVVLETDPAGRIRALRRTPIPRTWAELGDLVRGLAPRASFLATEIDRDGRIRPVYGVAPTTRRPIGSAMALYVLGALAHAVGQGRLRWDEPLAVRDAWKTDLTSSVGSVPDGTMLSLRRYADDAIFSGDASAIDHLLGRLGRGAVEAQQVRFGHAQVGANLPFLTARETTQLKVHPRMGEEYIAADGPRERLGYLRDVVARLPRPTEFPDEPRLTDSVEWFASPTDVSRAFAGLVRQAATQPAVGAVLGQQGTASLGLDAGRWPVGWSKNGVEPGVVTENFLAGTQSGRTFVVSLMVTDPDPVRPLDLDATRAALLAGAAGAFTLLTS
ncbi:serine hydrolase [Cryptosporangium aurantiacum]|uniref:serine hydrolase n=1 Tax=Cryptosporangium aurantiacum TaxID=134849 RepID=UPI001FE7F6F6|nr:serine hydrolase [Cryptosporangium aurantiacum]